MLPHNSYFIRISRVILPLLVFILPILFIPGLQNAFILPKIFAVVLVVFVLLAAYLFDTFKSGRLSYDQSLTLPLFGFISTIGIISALATEGRVESFLGTGIVYLSLSVLTYLLLANPDPKRTHLVLTSFTLGSALLAVFSTLHLTFLHTLAILPLSMQSRSFTPVGTPLFAVTILALGSILSFAMVSTAKNNFQKYVSITTGVLSLIALVAYLALMMPGQELYPLILPLRAGWTILLDAWKSPRLMAIGVGFANFPLLFTQVKPLFLNSTPFWNLIAQSSSSELFQLATTGGLLTIATFAILLIKALKDSYGLHYKPIFALLLASLILFVALPSHIILLTMLFIALGSVSSGELKHVELSKTVSLILGVIAMTTGLYALYFLSLSAMAEYQMRQAQLALTANDGAGVYSHNLKAVELVPRMTSYRISYSQVNLSLAGALSQKQTLSDADKGNITQLASQSVREGKLATDLSPNSSQAWNNLGIVYRNLINVASGADQYAITSYAKAVSLDSGNASLHVEFGGLLQQLSASAKDDSVKAQLLSRASQEFQTAIQLKPDYANAYYNLSKVLETGKDYNNAYLALQKAISLLGPDNADLSRANTELETLKGKLPKPTPTPSPLPTPSSPASDLATPSPLPSPISGEPISITP